MSRKMLIVDLTKCTGCRMCEVACSQYNQGRSQPECSRVHIVKWDDKGLDVPVMCLQCEVPFCKTACPVKAIYRDEKLGVYRVNYDKCSSCGLCVLACPYGGMTLLQDTKKVAKCDVCGGDPKCARFCPTGALSYIEENDALLREKRTRDADFRKMMMKTGSALDKKRIVATKLLGIAAPNVVTLTEHGLFKRSRNQAK